MGRWLEARYGAFRCVRALLPDDDDTTTQSTTTGSYSRIAPRTFSHDERGSCMYFYTDAGEQIFNVPHHINVPVAGPTAADVPQLVVRCSDNSHSIHDDVDCM